MGVYIPGMEMPTNCSACPLAIDNECGITHYEPTFAEWYENGVKDCPLIPVPEHGRLIDAYALMARFSYSPEDTAEDRIWIRAARRIIIEAPTIIPADKEEQT